ncbi:Short-chain dehydrogenase/reductase SDR - like 10 [Theobroma cacao]|nr:Short-chain dehydrogenase/reductase SDR - like 10 [Theobroma cacao]
MYAFSSTLYVVVTSANKGIGLQICNQLASKGITGLVTARDKKRGLEAIENMKQCSLSDNVVFHQLNVADPTSIASLVDFIKTQFEKLDILVLFQFQVTAKLESL